jgi:hypothetical protein
MKAGRVEFFDGYLTTTLLSAIRHATIQPHDTWSRGGRCRLAIVTRHSAVANGGRRWWSLAC